MDMSLNLNESKIQLIHFIFFVSFYIKCYGPFWKVLNAWNVKRTSFWWLKNVFWWWKYFGIGGGFFFLEMEQDHRFIIFDILFDSVTKNIKFHIFELQIIQMLHKNDVFEFVYWIMNWLYILKEKIECYLILGFYIIKSPPALCNHLCFSVLRLQIQKSSHCQVSLLTLE